MAYNKSNIVGDKGIRPHLLEGNLVSFAFRKRRQEGGKLSYPLKGIVRKKESARKREKGFWGKVKRINRIGCFLSSSTSYKHTVIFMNGFLQVKTITKIRVREREK